MLRQIKDNIIYFKLPYKVEQKNEQFISFVKELSSFYGFTKEKINLQINYKINGTEFDVYWKNNSFGRVFKYAIDCKEHTKCVSGDTIKDFLDKLKTNNITKAIFITNTNFKEECYEIAKKESLYLLTIKDFDQYKRSRLVSAKKCYSANTKKYTMYPQISLEISKNDNNKLLDIEQYLKSQKPVFLKQEHSKKILFLDYIKQIINQNCQQEIENELNIINKKYNNPLFIYKDPNEKVPIKAIKVEYIFKNITSNTTALIKFDLFNSIILETKKISMFDNNYNITTYNPK